MNSSYLDKHWLREVTLSCLPSEVDCAGDIAPINSFLVADTKAMNWAIEMILDRRTEMTAEVGCLNGNALASEGWDASQV